jgi:hypothetical protein
MQLIAVFPELAGPAVFPIIVLRVSLRQDLHEVDHSLLCAWKNQEVSMVRHQTVSNDGCVVLLCQFSGSLEVIQPILFFLEYILAVVSALYGVMAYVGDNEASVSRHD